MDSQTKYTVFVDNSIGGTSFFLSGDGLGCPDGLQECIDFASTFVGHYGERFTPVAWMDGWGRNNGTFRSDAIAAGRTITLIDGKYVPQGVEAGKPIEEKAEQVCTKAPATEVDGEVDAWFDAMEAGCSAAMGTPERLFAPLPKPEPAKFDPHKGFFDNWQVRSFHNWMEGEERAENQGPLQKLGDTSNPLHGSAHLGSMSHQLGSAWKK